MKKRSYQKDYFLNPKDVSQRKYETLRSIFVDKLTPQQVAKKFKYSIHTIYSYTKEFNKKKKLEIFLPLKIGPQSHNVKTLSIKNQIINLRKKNYSIIFHY